MSNNLHNLFRNISEIELSSELEGEILRGIELEIVKRYKLKFRLSVFGLIASGAALSYLFLTTGSAILNSEFWSIASLAFTDALIVAQNWKEFAYSLLETFPVTLVIIFTVPIFTLLLSMSNYFNLPSYNQHKYI